MFSTVKIYIQARFDVHKKLILWLGLTAMLMNTLTHSGCATWGSKVGEISLPRKKPAAASSGWWYVRFQMNWPENADPAMYLDVMLAHKVVAPVLKQYQKNIGLWRFHRRAARDNAGHQFSFIFYSTASTAREIYDSFTADPFLNQLKQAGIILQDTFDDTGQVIRSAIESTSDQSWSVQIQKSWPYFIMGVSQTWLNLIAEIAGKRASGHRLSSLQEIQGFYQQINEAITASWREEGRHAFLHHLNAIFGYEPVIVHEKQFMKF